MTNHENSVSPNPKTFKYAVPIVVLFGVLAILPAYFWGFPVGADFNNHFRFALPLYDEIGQGNYFPGWLAESNNGYGDPRFRFYPPFLYYLLCLFRYLFGDWYFASLAVFTLFSIIGALGVYYWTKRSFNNQTALAAAFIYTLVPYHLTQFYQASLLAEYAAASFLPFGFLFIEKLTNDRLNNTLETLSNIAALAAVYSLIITTHLPTTVISSLSLGIFALLLIDWKNNRKPLFYCAAAVALALVSSSWFWVKMLSELNWIQAGEKVSSEHYDYRNNFIFSPFSLTNLNNFYGSLVAALTVGVFLPTMIFWRRIFSQDGFESNHASFFADNELKVKRRLRASFVMIGFTLFMTTDLSRPVWAIVPKLKDIQFPYRWLTITSIMICPLTAFSFFVWREYFAQKKIRAIHLPLFLAFAAALFFTIQNLIVDSEYISRSEFTKRTENMRGAPSFNDWLPRGAKESKDLQPLREQIDAGSRRISIEQWQTHYRSFSAEAGTETKIRLRTYFYPLWQAFIIKDGRKFPIETSKTDDGTLLITIPNEAANVEVAFVEPPRTTISLLISVFGWMLIFALIIVYFAKPLRGENKRERI